MHLPPAQTHAPPVSRRSPVIRLLILLTILLIAVPLVALLLIAGMAIIAAVIVLSLIVWLFRAVRRPRISHDNDGRENVRVIRRA